ncbi:vanadium-dependent haloperoxidase [Radiobacillus sp. PE A8.2]|uniref:vanadium-dependent haloperoxidase n=1 Tax=Radiobacillus sp. PE A8.2 TaxID=3380349 RepID=UPI00388D980A
MSKNKRQYELWTDIPYSGENHPPDNPEEPLAGSWRTYFIRHDQDVGFETLDGRPIKLEIESPVSVDFEKELKVVQRVLDNITEDQITKAQYWGTGAPTKQWTPVADRLIDTYGVEAPRAARILAILQAGINDAFVVTWYLKYKWIVARPNQLDQDLVTIICTPRHPSYPSGHAVVSGAAETILSYFFPAERKKIRALAEENAMSRLFAGVHFPSDNNQGLRLGRQIGEIVINEVEKDHNSAGNAIETPYRHSRNAVLMPPPYEQVIPYEFDSPCASRTVTSITPQRNNNLPKPKLYVK